MDGRDSMDDAPRPTDWGARLRRHTTRPPFRFVIASIGLHLFVAGALYAVGVRVPKLPEFEQFRVNLVSPPPQVQGPPEPVPTTAPVVVPEPPKPEPQPEPPKPEPPRPEPPRTQPARPQPVERQPDPKPAQGPDPKPAAVGGENINVVRDGREFQYPLYLENIIRQMYRYSRWTEPANLEAEVVFYINRDGSIGGLRLVRRSGNFNFDAQAMRAAEEAGRNRAFGELPADWQRDRLWIQFEFKGTQ
jgi:outer membrane biosynthesis protein TonB